MNIPRTYGFQNSWKRRQRTGLSWRVREETVLSGHRVSEHSLSPSPSLSHSFSLPLSQRPKGEKDQRRQHAQKEVSQSLLIHLGLEGRGYIARWSNLRFTGRVLPDFLPHSGHVMVFGTRIRWTKSMLYWVFLRNMHTILDFSIILSLQKVKRD